MFVPKSIDSIKVYEQKNAIYKDSKLGDYYITNTKFEELKGFEVNANDIIVSCAGTIGETFIMPKNIEKGIINQALMLIRLFDCTLMPFYLLYFDFVLKKEASNQGKGTAIKNIPPFDILKGFLMPLPPISEQERIIIEIKEILRIIDSIGGNKTDLSKAIKQAKAKVLDLAIRGKLVPQDSNDEPASVLLERIKAEKQNSAKTSKKAPKPTTTTSDNSHYPFEIPESWVWCRFDELNSYISNIENPKSNTKYELYSVPIFENGIPEFVNGSEIGSSKQSVECKDILLCKINPRINRVWWVTHFDKSLKCLASAEWIVFRNSIICTAFIVHYFQSALFRDMMLSNVSGVGGSLMRARPDSVKKYNIPLPPLAEQQRIVAKIEEIFKQLDNIEVSLKA